MRHQAMGLSPGAWVAFQWRSVRIVCFVKVAQDLHRNEFFSAYELWIARDKWARLWRSLGSGWGA